MMRAQPANSGVAAAKPTILFIDDEPRVLKSMRATFRKDHEVHTANSGAEALALIDEHDIDVVVSDQRMPSMTGVEVLTEIKARSPQTARILLTGYADLAAVEAALNDAEVFRYLMKPCPTDEVRSAVADALQQEAPAHLAEVVALPVASVQAANVQPARPKPVADQPARVAAGAGDAELKRCHVLVLGHPDLEQAFAQTFEGGLRVHACNSFTDAEQVLEQQPINVLVTELQFDHMDLTDVIDRVREHAPQVVSIVASDRSDANVLIALINSGQIFRFLLKPLQSGRLRLTMQAAAERCVTGSERQFADPAPQDGRWVKFKNWFLGNS